jgi:hypothetical protein
MNAIFIVQGYHLEADLYLFGKFPDYDRITDRLRKYHVFNKIVAVDCSKFRSLSQIKALWQTINSRRSVSSFLPSEVNYDIMYSSSRAHVKLLMRKELERRNPKIKFVLFEDGLGTYSAQSHVLNSSRLRRLVETICNWNSFAPQRTKMIVTHPEFVELPQRLKGVIVEKMPLFNWSTENCDMLLDIFSVHKDELIDERVVVFDVTRGVYKNNLDVDVCLLDECYKLLKEKFSYHDVICKPHPRSRQKSRADLKEYQKKGAPVEILYVGMPDLEDRILVGTFSTALFTPKMLFGKEPVIICLHKMVWPRNTEIPPLFSKLSRMYQHKDRVMVPSNLTELSKCLDKIKNVVSASGINTTVLIK